MTISQDSLVLALTLLLWTCNRHPSKVTVARLNCGSPALDLSCCSIKCLAIEGLGRNSSRPSRSVDFMVFSGLAIHRGLQSFDTGALYFS